MTGTGGDVLFVEATTMDGDDRLPLTGQLGDVMKESAQIALSYVRAHAGELGIRPRTCGAAFHVHVPAGAIPKDGPSAGVTMVTALASLLTGRPVKDTVGMTGEVTLQGRVLPIGGVKQKVLAAHAAGLTEVIIPERNRADLEDVPEDVREAMTFHPVMTSARCSTSRWSPRANVRCRRCNPVPEEVRRAVDLLERRWTLSILYASFEGAVRFNEFLESLVRVPPATLTTRLERARRRGPARAPRARHTAAGRRVPHDARGEAVRAPPARARALRAALRRGTRAECPGVETWPESWDSGARL